MSAEPEDLETIAPEESEVVVDGVRCRVKRLRTREVLTIVRVLTRGIGPGVQDLDFTGPRDQVAQELAGALIVAVPESPDEFLQFVSDVVEPIDESNLKPFQEAIRNPELETLLEVAEAVAVQEADNLKSLMGKATAMANRVSGVYRRDGDAGRSPERST